MQCSVLAAPALELDDAHACLRQRQADGSPRWCAKFVAARHTYQGHTPCERVVVANAECVWVFELSSGADIDPTTIVVAH
jgi:hypothetical protein